MRRTRPTGYGLLEGLVREKVVLRCLFFFEGVAKDEDSGIYLDMFVDIRRDRALMEAWKELISGARKGVGDYCTSVGLLVSPTSGMQSRYKKNFFQ